MGERNGGEGGSPGFQGEKQEKQARKKGGHCQSMAKRKRLRERGTEEIRFSSMSHPFPPSYIR